MVNLLHRPCTRCTLLGLFLNETNDPAPTAVEPSLNRDAGFTRAGREGVNPPLNRTLNPTLPEARSGGRLGSYRKNFPVAGRGRRRTHCNATERRRTQTATVTSRKSAEICGQTISPPCPAYWPNIVPDRLGSTKKAFPSQVLMSRHLVPLCRLMMSRRAR
jgi:hypothetical protein